MGEFFRERASNNIRRSISPKQLRCTGSVRRGVGPEGVLCEPILRAKDTPSLCT